MFHLLKHIKPTTFFHVTHWKAGSQWIHQILLDCARDKIILPEAENRQFLKNPLLPGKVYPTLYLTYEQFHQQKLPKHYQFLFIIRDLRDSLVSLYYSMKVSHPLDQEGKIQHERQQLSEFNKDEGLLYLMQNYLDSFAEIQHSWQQAGATFYRYEDLLQNDSELLTPILTRAFPLSAKAANQIIIDNRFQKIASGRERGQEDIQSHARKAMPGDWQNHFNDNLKQEFKRKYGDLLIKTGYENNHHW